MITALVRLWRWFTAPPRPADYVSERWLSAHRSSHGKSGDL